MKPDKWSSDSGTRRGTLKSCQRGKENTAPKRRPGRRWHAGERALARIFLSLTVNGLAARDTPAMNLRLDARRSGARQGCRPFDVNRENVFGRAGSQGQIQMKLRPYLSRTTSRRRQRGKTASCGEVPKGSEHVLPVFGRLGGMRPKRNPRFKCPRPLLRKVSHLLAVRIFAFPATPVTHSRTAVARRRR